jgi:hypothetical protein
MDLTTLETSLSTIFISYPNEDILVSKLICNFDNTDEFTKNILIYHTGSTYTVAELAEYFDADTSQILEDTFTYIDETTVLNELRLIVANFLSDWDNEIDAQIINKYGSGYRETKTTIFGFSISILSGYKFVLDGNNVSIREFIETSKLR